MKIGSDQEITDLAAIGTLQVKLAKISPEILEIRNDVIEQIYNVLKSGQAKIQKVKADLNEVK